VTAAEVYRAYVAAETRRDREGMTALLAPDVTIEVNGRATLGSAVEDAEAMAALFDAYPDYRRELVEVIEQGDQAAARWRMVGTPRPDLAGRLPELDIQGCSFVTVADGRMTEAHVWSPPDAIESILRLVAR
jgi:ketosteroid isomerase-like protein